MKRSAGTVPELSPRVRELIEEIFPHAYQHRIRELIREFHWPLEPLVDERIHLDILEVCGGKMEKVRELIDLAKTDWRDLIMTAEYELRDGKIVQNERGRKRLEQSGKQ